MHQSHHSRCSFQGKDDYSSIVYIIPAFYWLAITLHCETPTQMHQQNAQNSLFFLFISICSIDIPYCSQCQIIIVYHYHVPFYSIQSSKSLWMIALLMLCLTTNKALTSLSSYLESLMGFSQFFFWAHWIRTCIGTG